VTWRKQRRIITAARHLLMKRADLRRFPARFDVVAISSGLRGVDVKWIKAAFTT
jgi:Holliday junction resolvase-like predicted endonuclease